MRHASTLVLFATALGAVGCLAPVDEAAWDEDLGALETHLSSAYANLDDASAAQGIDPIAWSEGARRELGETWTEGGARGVLTRRVAMFQDPHLRLEAPPSRLASVFGTAGGGGDDGDAIEPGLTGAEAVARLGFTDDGGGFRIDFDDAPTFVEISSGEADDPFAACVVEVDGARVGIVRIAEFGVDRYASVAAAAVDVDPSVLERGAGTVWLAAEQALVDRLAARVRGLAARGIDVLAVDVTGNGGGTDWADPAARILTPIPLHGAPVSLVRHEHHEVALLRQASRLRGVLRGRQIDPADRALVEDAVARLNHAWAEVRDRSDRTGVFTGAAVRTPLLAREVVFATGPFPYLPPDVLADVPERADLFHPFAYRYEEGVWSGPLLVLVDGATASASEQFTALLRDHDACRVVGRRTLGAGAGTTRGGIDFTLPRSGLRVRAPDIVRHRQDGTNELFGIAPDVEIPADADPDDPAVWTRAMGAAMRRP